MLPTYTCFVLYVTFVFLHFSSLSFEFGSNGAGLVEELFEGSTTPLFNMTSQVDTPGTLYLIMALLLPGILGSSRGLGDLGSIGGEIQFRVAGGISSYR